METNLLDRMLNAYLSEQTPVTITLQNRIRLSGKMKAFDSYVIIMEGQKREIVYRHAISSITASTVAESAVRTAQAAKPSAKTASRPQKSPHQKPRSSPPASLPASSPETSINNSMKEGLLRWMQEQNAAK